MSTTTPQPAIKTYGRWRNTVTSSIGDLSDGILLTLGALLMGTIFAMAIGKWILVGIFVAVGLTLFLLSAWRDRHGRTKLQDISDSVMYRAEEKALGTYYQSGLSSKISGGLRRLPGIAAGSELYEVKDNFQNVFAMIHYPSKQHFVIVFTGVPNGDERTDIEDRDQKVGVYGEFLNTLSSENRLVGAASITEIAPRSTALLRRSIEANIDPDAGDFAQEVMRELAQNEMPSAPIKSYMVLTYLFDKNEEGNKISVEEASATLVSRLPALQQALAGSGISGVRMIGTAELTEDIHMAVDPASAPLIEEIRLNKEASGLSWNDIGPTSAHAGAKEYEHNGAVSMTWEMTEPPRSEVQGSVLKPLLASCDGMDRKRVTLLYRPIDPETGTAIVEKDVRHSRFSATTGKRVKATGFKDVDAADGNEAAQANGRELTNFGMLITATVHDARKMDQLKETVNSLGVRSRLKIRPAYGMQSAFFYAALPLGIVLPEYINTPDELKKNRKNRA